MSLLRFRSVCKSWFALINSSTFINRHLLQQDRNSMGNLIVKIDRSGTEWCLLSGNEFEVRVNLDLTRLLPLGLSLHDDLTWVPIEMAASYNGIICVYTVRFQGRLCVALWNPAMRELSCLPTPTLHSNEYEVFYYVGFGYVVKTGDYKVVSIAQFRNEDRSLDDTKIEVYSLQTDSWKIVDFDFPVGSWIYGAESQRTYINGHYCWAWVFLDRKNYHEFSILSFDMSNEVFEVIPLPDVVSTRKSIHLTTMCDSITCIDTMDYNITEENHQLDIWVLKEYNVKESWTKQYTVKLNIPIIDAAPESFSKNGEFMLLRNWVEHNGHLELYDPITQEIIKTLVVQFDQVDVYKESLVSTRKRCH